MKKILLGMAFATMGLCAKANTTNEFCREAYVASDTMRASMSMRLGADQVQQVLQGLQLPEELMQVVTAPGVENVSMSVNAEDVRYLLESLGLDANLLQMDASTGSAKIAMGPESLPQVMQFVQAFPELLKMELDQTTRSMKMGLNGDKLNELLSSIKIDPSKLNVQKDASGKNVSVGIDSENMHANADGLKAAIQKTGTQGTSANPLAMMQQAGVKPKLNITQRITDPVIVSSTTDKVKIEYFIKNAEYWIVVLDVTACEGKLKGIDGTAYFEADGVKYALKEVKEAKIPANAKEAMTWDASTVKQLNLVFEPVKVTANSQMELVLSTAKNGVRIKTHFRTNR